MESFIQIEKLTIQRQGYRVLDTVNLTIPLGRTTFILGASGSGKSTLVKALAGLSSPDEGNVKVLGKDYRDMSALEEKIFRRSAAFVFQDGALWANQTIYNNLLVPLLHHEPELSAEKAKLRIKAALAEVGFVDDSNIRPAFLSTGEQKLAAFARSLVLNPQILFMDEPTSFIDEAGERKINRILQRLSLEGKTVIAVGNMYDLAFRIADYLCIINKGKIQQMGTVLDVCDKWPDFLEPLENRHNRILDKRRAKGGDKL